MCDVEKSDITVDVVSCLLREQFPQWAELPVRRVELDGHDNTTFRVGSELSARLPSADRYIAQVNKEHFWLPILASRLPLPIPTPIARGEAGCGFPRPWSIYGWVEGEPAASAGVDDLELLADDLARFLRALHEIPSAGGPTPGPHSFDRGGPVSGMDGATRAAIGKLHGRIDTEGARNVWEAVIGSPWHGPDVWVHGDVVASNLLVGHDRLCGVIDFGCCAVGDPACDLTMAWTMFEGSSRSRFMQAIPVDAGTWDRARGWARWKAVIALPELPEDHPRNNGSQFGWRWPAVEVIHQIITDKSGSSEARP